MSEEHKEFKYFLNDKRNVLVVTITGMLNDSDKDTVQDCLEEVLQTGAQHIILNLQGFADIQNNLVRNFVQLQKELREKPAELYVCFLQKELKRKLEAEGALRSSEVFADLTQALSTMAKKIKNT